VFVMRYLEVMARTKKKKGLRVRSHVSVLLFVLLYQYNLVPGKQVQKCKVVTPIPCISSLRPHALIAEGLMHWCLGRKAS
jgi:hypothetical protein